MLRQPVLAAIFLLTGPLSLAAAADNFLKIIPSNALAWGAISCAHDANAKILKLSTVVYAPGLSLLEILKSNTGIKKGLSEQGACGFFLVPGKTDAEPISIFFLAVRDFQDFVDNFEIVKKQGSIARIKLRGSEVCVAEKGGYALLTTSSSDRKALDDVLNCKESVAPQLSGWTEWLAQNDGNFVATNSGIQLFAKLKGQELKKSADSPQVAAKREADLGPLHDVYKRLLNGSFNEVSIVAVGFQLAKQGTIKLVGRAQLTSGGCISKAFAHASAPKENLLGGLPGDEFVIACGGSPLAVDCLALVQFLCESSPSATNEPAGPMRQYAKRRELVRQASCINMSVQCGGGGEPPTGRSYMFLRVDNAKRFLDAWALQDAPGNNRAKPSSAGNEKTIEQTRTLIGGQPALVEEEISDDSSATSNANGDSESTPSPFQPEGNLKLYTVAVDEHTIMLALGVSKERMATVMKSRKDAKSCLPEDSDLAVTAALLPKDAHAALYLGLGGLSAAAKQSRETSISDNGNQPPLLFDFPKCPPIGVTLKGSADELNVEVVVPPALVATVGEAAPPSTAAMIENILQLLKAGP